MTNLPLTKRLHKVKVVVNKLWDSTKFKYFEQLDILFIHSRWDRTFVNILSNTAKCGPMSTFIWTKYSSKLPMLPVLYYFLLFSGIIWNTYSFHPTWVIYNATTSLPVTTYFSPETHFFEHMEPKQNESKIALFQNCWKMNFP